MVNSNLQNASQLYNKPPMDNFYRPGMSKLKSDFDNSLCGQYKTGGDLVSTRNFSNTKSVLFSPEVKGEKSSGKDKWDG
jgi:hypothetical protein